MKIHTINEPVDQVWFIGNFPRAIWKTDVFDVVYRFVTKGTVGPIHFHRSTKEMNLVTQGCVRVNKVVLHVGDVYEAEPGEAVECEYIEDNQIDASS
jgi:hypothetical protein